MAPVDVFADDVVEGFVVGARKLFVSNRQALEPARPISVTAVQDHVPMNHNRLALAMRRDIFGQVGQLARRQQIEQPGKRMIFQAIVT
jgi:hypothetical protein